MERHLVKTILTKGGNEGGKVSGILGEWYLPKSTVRVQLAEHLGSCELSKGIVDLREWVYFSEDILV